MKAPAELTKNQALVLDALSHAEGPLSAYTILDRLRDDGFRAPLQVYRALEKLQELGLVHRLESINAFVACAHPHDHHQELIAFAICENCGKVDEFSDEMVEERLGRWAKAHDFRPSKTTIEIRGACRTCSSA
ncbi:Fur family zinc uptake transcriptional regulator [Mesorhizobium sp. J18]|uniref:Fur family transcriptional regulator n=1 Tax=Mesorhizobium sp. J18 TaxID=935263 RepID=UPI00119BA235|nr:Fur family transcriptional regulator [Mesorhizobium sp. J18]TWG91350.1 Fur family zinc uptake transcriptional regulator [Mesorhizobium sp. J18]